MKKWNHDEWWFERKELDYFGFCRSDHMWNPSNCDCECSKACKIDEYLDTKTCSCEKQLTGNIVLECEDEMLNTIETSLNDKKHRKKIIVLFARFHL